MPVVVLFRQDLRLRDHPALWHASKTGDDIVPLFVWSPEDAGDWKLGAAARWWTEKSLRSLSESLKARGLNLVLRKGPQAEVLPKFLEECGARAVYWNSQYEPTLRQADRLTRIRLEAKRFVVHEFNGALLWDPEQHKSKGGAPYQVFTPFWKAAQQLAPPDEPLAMPRLKASSMNLSSLRIEDLRIASARAPCFAKHWEPGEEGGHRALKSFLERGLVNYVGERDLPAIDGTSRLSPYLARGDLSVRQIYRALSKLRPSRAREKFVSELAWREFAHALMYWFPHTPNDPLRAKYKDFPWRHDQAGFKAWCEGRTGFPIVDAGMRELMEKGWMHNRVRMIVSSFLVKDLLVSWQEGARWFWEHLVDANLANNTLGWQWAAGCGADAAPFFRIFNPTLQGAKFDPRGEYVKRWAADSLSPIVDHASARARALETFKSFNARAGKEP